MKKWIMGSLAILLGVMSISIPFAGIHTEMCIRGRVTRMLVFVICVKEISDWIWRFLLHI